MKKTVGLLNVDGYCNSLFALFDKGVEEGFIEDSAKQELEGNLDICFGKVIKIRHKQSVSLQPSRNLLNES
ncbi:hypothetical protein ACHQM5_001015 [Ranunculus cassubicifolius]